MKLRIDGRPPRHALRALGCLTLLVGFGQPVAAQTLRVSVKHILDSNGNRSTGDPAAYCSTGCWTQDLDVITDIAECNTVLANNGFDWSLEITEIVDVAGVSQYFTVTAESEVYALESAAIANPSLYQWRSDAINIYIVDRVFDKSGGKFGGYCSFPTDHEIIVMNNTSGIANDGVGWLHEIGHYLSLTHTFQGGTSNDDCTGIAAYHGPDLGLGLESCPDTCPHTTNVMSYDVFSLGSSYLSPCQKGHMEFELFDPAGSRNKVICVGTIVPGDDILAALPNLCADGVLSLSAGTYLQGPITISGPVTLTATGGFATIQ